MLFNPDPNKQANGVYSSRKTNLDSCISLELNKYPINFCKFRKLLDLFLHLGRK